MSPVRDSTPDDTGPTRRKPLALPGRERISVPWPTALTSFVSREQEIATLIDLLRHPEVRLVTITGPGGIGKTRLALQVADGIGEHFPDGVVIVGFAAVRDPQLVLPAVALALGVPETSGEAVIARLRTAIGDRRLLLVLDNLEHLADAGASLMADLLGHCPNLTALVTSRMRLGISGERLMPLDGMSPEAARALFTTRVQDQVPAFVLTDDLASVVDGICGRLDRLPLAIELAAARSRVLPPHALLARLDQRLDLLTGGPRDALPQQRDMRQTIAWSHDLLDPSDQVIFRRLGVFVGGFTLEAAEAVIGTAGDGLDGVSRLVEASLVNPIEGVGDEPRFTMLETIREYALEQLTASDDASRAHCAQAHHIASLAESLWELPEGPLTEAVLQRLRPEAGNIRLALGWTLANEPDTALQLVGALVDYWVLYSSYGEGRDWVGRALAATPEVSASARYRARAQLAAGWLAMDHGDLAVAEVHLADAMAGARQVADEKLLTACVMISGQAALKGNQLSRARQMFEAGRTYATTSEPIRLAIATASLGQVAMAMGNLAAAQRLFEEALAIHQAGSGPTGVAFGHLYLGQVALAQGNHTRAAASFREAITFFTVNSEGNIPRALEGLAGVFATLKPDHAARLLGVAAAIRGEDGWPRDPVEVPAWEHAAGTARAALGEPGFEAAWDAGRQLSWEDVLAEDDAAIAEFSAASSPNPDTTHGLSPREVEVLRLLVDGRSNRVIGETLFLSERTIENHVMHILDKLGLETRTAAATYAVRHGLA